MLIHNNFRSWCLQTNTDVDIIIPDPPQGVDTKEFYRTTKKFPVLWLLHGTWGGYNDFVRRTSIDLYAKECNLIVVMPNGMNSDYSNWPDAMMGYNMFDFLTEELMPMVHNWLPASDKKEDNFICGLSMGAMGAAKYAVNHPDLFGGCSAMSGTPRDIQRLAAEGKLEERTLKSIEKSGGLEKYLASYENVWGKFKDLAGKPDAPKFRFSCGTEDFLYDSYLEFKKYAEEIGLDASFSEVPGFGHEWRFWDLELQETLRFFGFAGKRNVTTQDAFRKIDASNL